MCVQYDCFEYQQRCHCSCVNFSSIYSSILCLIRVSFLCKFFFITIPFSKAFSVIKTKSTKFFASSKKQFQEKKNESAEGIIISFTKLYYRFMKLLLFLGMKLKQAQDTKPHVLSKTISEFALEYRTIRQRVLETKKRKENMKKRTKTRGKLITEVCALNLYFDPLLSMICISVSAILLPRSLS